MSPSQTGKGMMTHGTIVGCTACPKAATSASWRHSPRVATGKEVVHAGQNPRSKAQSSFMDNKDPLPWMHLPFKVKESILDGYYVNVYTLTTLMVQVAYPHRG